MIKKTEAGIDIDVKSYLKEVKGLYYVVLVYVNAAGKRRDKSFPTKLPIKGNKVKAKKMSDQILSDFVIPNEDIYIYADKKADKKGKKTQVSAPQESLTLPREMLEKITLDDLSNEQVANLLFSDYIRMYVPYTRKRKKPIEDTTYASYYSNVKSPIGPYFAEKGIKLKDLTAEDIQKFYDDQLQRVKSNSVIHYHAIIRLSLTYARKKGYISENPIDQVDKPEKNTFVGKYYSADELMALIQASKGTKLEVAVLMGGFYGLRRSECVGLRWEAFDFDNNIFYINHTVTTPKMEDGEKIVAKDRGKSKSSLRALPLDVTVKERLLAIRETQEMYRKKFKGSYNKKWIGYVMVDELGNLIKPDYITESFPRLLKRHGMRRIRFHDLRHTSASLLLSRGVPLKDIQLWLGHSDFSTTANTYAHLDSSSKKASLEALAGVVHF